MLWCLALCLLCCMCMLCSSRQSKSHRRAKPSCDAEDGVTVLCILMVVVVFSGSAHAHMYAHACVCLCLCMCVQLQFIALCLLVCMSWCLCVCLTQAQGQIRSAQIAYVVLACCLPGSASCDVFIMGFMHVLYSYVHMCSGVPTILSWCTDFCCLLTIGSKLPRRNQWQTHFDVFSYSAWSAAAEMNVHTQTDRHAHTCTHMIIVDTIVGVRWWYGECIIQSHTYHRQALKCNLTLLCPSPPVMI